jgi:succinoglycan biosynthesis protein ExoM
MLTKTPEAGLPDTTEIRSTTAIAAHEDAKQSLVVICVCTCRRPKMLDDCLLSLMRQQAPANALLAAVVVDNEAQPNNRAEVENWAAVFPYPLHYVHQPDPGIPQARNAALATALELGADWVAFLDDDEKAEPSWISQLHASALEHNADVVQGLSVQVYPDETPHWKKRGQYRPEKHKKQIKTAITNNVIFRAKTVIDHGLTFDNRLRFIGGEDLNFFRAMYDCGASLIFDPSAVVMETIPPERTTVRWHMRNAFRKGVCRITEASLHGKTHIRRKALLVAFRKALSSALKLCASPFCAVAGSDRSAYVFLSGCRDASQAVGCVYGLLGGKFEYYRRVTGC